MCVCVCVAEKRVGSRVGDGADNAHFGVFSSCRRKKKLTPVSWAPLRTTGGRSGGGEKESRTMHVRCDSEPNITLSTEFAIKLFFSAWGNIQVPVACTDGFDPAPESTAVL